MRIRPVDPAYGAHLFERRRPRDPLEIVDEAHEDEGFKAVLAKANDAQTPGNIPRSQPAQSLNHTVSHDVLAALVDMQTKKD